MSNLSFKNPFEMSHDDLLNYVADLEKRLANANNGALVFRGEANLNRTEMLKYKEIAGQAEDRTVTAILDVEKHLEMITGMLSRTEDQARSYADYAVLVRFIHGWTEDLLATWRKQYLGGDPEDRDPEDLSDIPF